MYNRLNQSVWIAALLLAMTCVGCTASPPPPADPKEARGAVETALEAWKRGETMQSLTERKPPIQFTDLNWEKGFTLEKYEITSAEPRGVSMRITVKLAMKTKEGQKRDAPAVYIADTAPRIVIVTEF